MDPYVLGTLRNLESLELGECCDFPEDFGPDALSRLKKLERLRLEKGQGQHCPTFSILEGIATLPKLNHLELINFDVKPGFDKALGQCKNIHRLLIIPTYVTQVGQGFPPVFSLPSNHLQISFNTPSIHLNLALSIFILPISIFSIIFLVVSLLVIL